MGREDMQLQDYAIMLGFSVDYKRDAAMMVNGKLPTYEVEPFQEIGENSGRWVTKTERTGCSGDSYAFNKGNKRIWYSAGWTLGHNWGCAELVKEDDGVERWRNNRYYETLREALGAEK